jgi:hypothetical protein
VCVWVCENARLFYSLNSLERGFAESLECSWKSPTALSRSSQNRNKNIHNNIQAPRRLRAFCDSQPHSRLGGCIQLYICNCTISCVQEKEFIKKGLDVVDEILNFAHGVITIVIISHPFEILTLWVCLNLENTIPIYVAHSLTRTRLLALNAPYVQVCHNIWNWPFLDSLISLVIILAHNHN